MKNPLRYATLEDAEGITNLLRAIGWFNAINQISVEEALKKIYQELKFCLNHPENHSIYVYEDMEGEIIGYISAHWIPMMILTGLEGYVSELFVHPDFQGKGIGPALLDSIKEEARSRGCVRLSLLNAKHRVSYQKHFYQKQGWQERDIMANFVFPLREK
ncbi:MAG: GNAT family N-acetyltransferase [Anaerolineaceae bacterium]|nr:GNAT family N-acetyltransferase [Anaerolineaceae bacterium]